MPARIFGAAVAAVLAVLSASFPARAAQIAGVTLPATEVVHGTRLSLVGCAAREELWTDLYVVSVYLPPEMRGVAQATSAQAVKLVRIDVTYDGNVPDGLPSAWKDRLQNKVSQEFQQTLQGQYNQLKSGDTVLVSYSPGGGTTLSVNGRNVASRPGDNVFNTMMQIWVGPSPVSENMKRLLLAGRC